jgi:signal transduction histidine kinase
MDLVDRQVTNLRAISQDFLDFTGGRRSSPERFDAAELATEVVELHAAWAEEHGVDLRLEGCGMLFVDRGKLRRVFENIVTNALHAVEGNGHVTLTISVTEGRVVVELGDDGIGISEEAREHLFEPYFTTRSEGTGLGLAIAKRVIEDMQGSIELTSREGGGTLVRIELPEAGPE